MKEAICMLSGTIDKISNQGHKINSLVKKIVQLKTLNAEQKNKIDTQETRVNERVESSI